jgi:hypothetical protein
MERRMKTLGISAYSYCCNLARLDFRSPDLSFENLEEDATRINPICGLNISTLNGCFDALLLSRDIRKSPLLIGLVKPCPDQETIMLRC